MTASAPAAIALARSPEYLMPPSAMTGMSAFARFVRSLHDRGELRHADAGDDARRADRAGADADLDRVGAGVDQRLGRLGGGDVAGDDRRPCSTAFLMRVTWSMTVCEWPCAVSITTQSTPASISCSARSKPWSPTVEAAATRSRPSCVLAGVGMLRRLLDVLDGDEADAAVILVDDEQLLDAMLVQQPLRLRPALRLRGP